MFSKIRPIFLMLACLSCRSQGNNAGKFDLKQQMGSQQKKKENPYAIINNIPLPAGYKRTNADSSSYAYWLRHTALKKDKTVYLFNGSRKTNQSAQFAVLDITVGRQDMQQCADAVMRLRAEYLFACNKFEEIVFSDNANTGYRFTLPYTRAHFQNYLTTVFGMCGSASLAKQLMKVDIMSIQPGDVLIRGGFPGHAVTVMDVAMNEERKKIFLLAQSYMPAQDIHVLLNPVDVQLSPWYDVGESEKIYTPEYEFNKNEFRRW